MIQLRKVMLTAVAAAVAASFFMFPSARAGNIIEDWANVKAPPPPELKPVTVDAKTHAVIVFDMLKSFCNGQRSPRCLAIVPTVAKLVREAKAKGVMVIYTVLTPIADPKAEIYPELGYTGNEPLMRQFLNKFTGTDLEKVLKDKNIQTVVAMGWAVNGAVLTTSTEVVARGMTVAIPVDAVASFSEYAEQYSASHFMNSPVIAGKITLTKSDMVKF